MLVFAFAVGVSVGSFATLASFRLPRGEEIVFRPSYCPCCNTALTARELIPLTSWLMQQGKCLHCKNPISIRYPLIEAALGLTFTALVWTHGLTLDTLLLCALATALCILIVTDLEHTLIPDGVQVALLVIGLFWQWHHHADWRMALAGSGGGLALGLSLHYGYLYLRKKDALGWGDVKFLCVAGLWLPWDCVAMFLLIAGVLGIATGLFWRLRGKGAIFPFGPALACSLFINVLFPDMLQRFL